MSHSEDQLIARRCAYWVNLRGAPPSKNTTSQTVLIPKEYCLSADALRSIAAQVSREKLPDYGYGYDWL